MNTKVSLKSLVSVGLLFATASALAGNPPPRVIGKLTLAS